MEAWLFDFMGDNHVYGYVGIAAFCTFLMWFFGLDKDTDGDFDDLI